MATVVPDSFYLMAESSNPAKHSGKEGKKILNNLIRVLIGVSVDHVLTRNDYQTAKVNAEQIDPIRLGCSIEEFKMGIAMAAMSMGIEERERNKERERKMDKRYCHDGREHVSKEDFTKFMTFIALLPPHDSEIERSELDRLIKDLAGLSNDQDLTAIVDCDDLLKRINNFENTGLASFKFTDILRRRVNIIKGDNCAHVMEKKRKQESDIEDLDNQIQERRQQLADLDMLIIDRRKKLADL